MKYWNLLQNLLKKVILLVTIFFVTYSSVNAIPFLGAVPFIFELGVLVYSFSFLVFSSLFFYYIKHIRVFVLCIGCVVLFSFLALNIYIWWDEVLLIHLAFEQGNIHYVTMCGLSALVFVIVLFTFKNKYAHLFLQWVWIFVLVVNVSLFHAIIDLDLKFDRLVDEFNTLVDWSAQESSDKTLNNIIVSQDFKYSYKWEDEICRLSLSYFIHNWWPYSVVAEKSSVIQLLTWLDDGQCRNILNSKK